MSTHYGGYVSTTEGLRVAASKKAATALTALIFGVGLSTAPETTSLAGKDFVGLYTKSTDATGADSRCMYLTHKLSGVNASGETLRAYTVLEGDTATAARGAYISLGFGAAGNISGEGQAIRGTLRVPDRAVSAGGNYHAIVGEIYCDGISSDLSPATTHAIFKGAVSGGDQAARRKVLYLMDIEAEAGLGYMVYTGQNEPVWAAKTCLIKVLINGTAMSLVAVAP